MKKVLSVLVGIVATLFVAALVPTASYAVDNIVNLVPSESPAVDDTCVPRFEAAPSDHFMDVSESQKFDRTAPKFEATPSEHYMDVSESQKVDTSIDTPPAVAHTPGNCAKTTN